MSTAAAPDLSQLLTGAEVAAWWVEGVARIIAGWPMAARGDADDPRLRDEGTNMTEDDKAQELAKLSEQLAPLMERLNFWLSGNHAEANSTLYMAVYGLARLFKVAGVSEDQIRMMPEQAVAAMAPFAARLPLLEQGGIENLMSLYHRAAEDAIAGREPAPIWGSRAGGVHGD